MFRQGFYLFEGGFPFLRHGGVPEGEGSLLGVATDPDVAEGLEKLNGGRGGLGPRFQVAIFRGNLIPDSANVFWGEVPIEHSRGCSLVGHACFRSDAIEFFFGGLEGVDDVSGLDLCLLGGWWFPVRTGEEFEPNVFPLENGCLKGSCEFVGVFFRSLESLDGFLKLLGSFNPREEGK